MRSENGPDILLYGRLFKMENFLYRNVRCISEPSVVATTNEMYNNENNNIVGNWFIKLVIDNKGKLVKIVPIDSTYYNTDKFDYKKSKVLKLNKEN